MKTCKLLSIALLFSALLVCRFASANDSSFGDSNGTIKFKAEPDISMDKEVLTISQKKVLVEYVFTNTSQKELTIPIAFPMPPMYFGQGDHSEIADFKLMVNGKQVKTERKLVVLLDNGQDITQNFFELGWDVNAVASLEEGEYPNNKKQLPARWLDKNNSPRFTISEYFIWKQTFPAGKPVAISHSYKPSISSGVPRPASEIIQTFKKSTCLNENAQSTIRKQSGVHGVNWEHLSYILMTAKNWQGPIKDFRLIIKKQNASDLLSLCFDEELVKTDSKTYQFHKQNFIPKRNLELLFISKTE
ncbi:protein of unknown function [Trichlorobacter thiogenes]|uniref:DUF4424 domain-containing protein n=1 Tax=Trichlorobacter thiogenes TaxID=115783 RepID=A0A1T4RTB5_9BACT|nr:DUF4424 family protein [Trichlorobacter thiogenes]SKA19116.1 protein of unknown function [Trichlorobacter thiogenes]